MATAISAPARRIGFIDDTIDARPADVLSRSGAEPPLDTGSRPAASDRGRIRAVRCRGARRCHHRTPRTPPRRSIRKCRGLCTCPGRLPPAWSLLTHEGRQALDAVDEVAVEQVGLTELDSGQTGQQLPEQ